MADALKSYPAPWHEHRLVLACRKCQKKLKGQANLKPLANLRKAVKKHNPSHPTPLHILNVKCMDLCPKNAVTICLPGLSDDRVRLLRSQDDLDALYSPLRPTPVALVPPQ